MEKVYFWGKDAAMGHSVVPKLVKFTGLKETPHIVDIVCGSYHSYAVTEKGEVLAWGRDIYTQLGCPPFHSENFSNWEIVQFEKFTQIVNTNKEKIVQIACGITFSMALSENGKIYGWGFPYSDYLEIKNRGTHESYLHQITLPRIVKVVCGIIHTLALTYEGKLYAWGENNYGQLGIGTTKNSSFPCMVTHEMGRVVDIAALHCSNISVASDEDGYVYMWGECRGQKILVPTKTLFSNIHDVFACYASPSIMHKPLQLDSYSNTNILECFENVFNDKSTSNLTILVENHPIYVHKLILKIRSTYFEKMFQHEWSENNKNVIEHDQFSYAVYKAFLKYVYTNVVDPISLDDTCELLILADAYCENNLKHNCIELIKRKVTTANVFLLYDTAIKHSVKELEDFCFKFALSNMTAAVLKIKELREKNLNELLVIFFIKAAEAGKFKT